MVEQLTYAQKIRSLRWNYAFAAANTIFTTLTVFGNVFILFLDKLGLPKSRIGFILSLFPFCGVVALFIAPHIARFGLKRTLVIFWGARKIVTCFLLLTPLVLFRYGAGSAFTFVAAVILMFAICRAVGESAFYPWLQEVIPDDIRGRFFATNSVVANVITIISIGFAGYVIGRSDTLNSFMLLMAIGIFFGFIAVWSSTRIPGGAPQSVDSSETRYFRDIIDPARDPNFLRYLLGIGAIAFTVGIAAFFPLYFAHEVGISSANVVLLSIAASLGGVISYVWGWAADKYGGKRALLFCLRLSLMVPIFLMLMPRHSEWSFLAASAIMFGSGAFTTGNTTASLQIMYVNLVPADNSTRYMALYYAWSGLIGGLSPILAGFILEHAKHISGRIGILTLDSYTPLLVLIILGTLAAILLVRSIGKTGRTDTV
ncbi:MAG: MFS transporter [Armatimonadota bacterium]